MDLGYDHVAFYAIERGRDALTLMAQLGDNAVMNAIHSAPMPTVWSVWWRARARA